MIKRLIINFPSILQISSNADALITLPQDVENFSNALRIQGRSPKLLMIFVGDKGLKQIVSLGASEKNI